MLVPATVAVALGALGALANAALVGLDDQSQVPLGHDQTSIGTDGENSAKRPNIVFILTDDQDAHLQSLDYMPLLKKHLLDQGTLYKRHYCTTAICCPARVTLWTGRAAHNTNVTDVNPPHGICIPITYPPIPHSKLTW